MASNWVGKDRFLALETPLGGDKLLLRSFTGSEGISRLFQFELDMLSEDSAIDFNRIVGQNVTFGVRLADSDKLRYCNGFVSRFAQLPGEERLTHYHAVVVPWLWFLSRTADCRVYQQKSVPDIIKSVFGDFGFQDFKDQLSGSYEPREFCVQYRETAFNFVSRLMEEEGIFYFFQHENGKHTLVLGDASSVHRPCPDESKVHFETVISAGNASEEDSVFYWRQEQELRPGKYATTDYNFETPSTSLLAKTNSVINQGGNTRFEVFDYPGDFGQKSQGDGLVRVRMEEEETAHEVMSGEGNCRTFVSGYRFDLSDHPRRDQNGSYVLTSVTHTAEEGGFYSGAGSETQAGYRNSFTAIPVSVPFRPPRQSRKPVVQGSQTAVVVGPSGEEIYTDKYGRVKVQFHWDRRGQKDENSSCWIRVSHPWAGRGWGAIWIPRIGQEVIVGFLEGDPDRPIITGRTYNAESMPPYTLPDEKTKSTVKSYSSKGGGGFNEIRLEDKKGKEQIFLHAERNEDIRVKNDVFETIGGERHLIIEKDQLEKVKGDKHLQVKKDKNEKVDGTVSLTAGMDLQEKVGMNYALAAGQAIHLKAGMNLVIESGVSLTLKVGGNFINLSPAGVAISGTMVMINSGGAAGSGAGCSPQSPKDPKEADTDKPGQAAAPSTPPTPPKVSSYSPAASVLKSAAVSGAPFCDI